MDLSNKRVVVVGLGTSGVAAARLCLRRGARVVGTDEKPKDALSAAARALEAAGATLAVGGHGAAGLETADLIVVSPGVPPFPELLAAERARVRIVSEVELATTLLMHPAPIVAVGGTNGKSTVTSLVGELLGAQGLATFVGGNLGEPLADHAEERFDAVVLEVSSFQMERLDTFRPRVALLLNVTDDHLDRYPSFQAYADAKGNAFVRQKPTDVAVVPAGDALCLAQARRGKGRVVTFGPGGDVDVTAEAVVDRRSGAKFPRSAMRLAGGHNALNVAAAVAAAVEMGVSPETVTTVLARFEGLAHRMAKVVRHRGVTFYDDSKGTNVGASVTALLGLDERRAVLIAGGKDKGGSYAPLVEALRARGRAAVLLGEAAPLLADAIGDALPVRRAATMDEAVRTAFTLAEEGDAVLLSPACSSFDMFKDYKHRGDEFVRAVRALAGEVS